MIDIAINVLWFLIGRSSSPELSGSDLCGRRICDAHSPRKSSKASGCYRVVAGTDRPRSRRWPAGGSMRLAALDEPRILWALITLIVAIALAFILLSTAKDETKSEAIRRCRRRPTIANSTGSIGTASKLHTAAQVSLLFQNLMNAPWETSGTNHAHRATAKPVPFTSIQ